MKHWIDNADSYVCPICKSEVNNPSKTGGCCPVCGWSETEQKNKSVEGSELFKSIIEQMIETYERKNHDYGNAFAELRTRHKNAILVRLFDKYMRLETLMGGEKAQVDESINDTLLDMANYCVLELVERRKEEEAE